MEHKKKKLSDKNEPSIVADFARRTIANLKVIEKQKIKKQDKFEITQLINSLMGIAIFPKEHELACFSSDKLSCDKLKKLGLTNAMRNLAKEEKSSLRQVVEHLRHATAHFCIDLKAESDIITEIHFWTHPNGDVEEDRDWEVNLAPCELRKLVEYIADHLTKEATDSSKP